MNQFAAYVPLDRRQAMANKQPLPVLTDGSALFADISGFTPLTEALMAELGPQKGAEAVTESLNRVYNGLIAAVHNYRGSVIGFAGDAITCWFDKDNGHRATAAGLVMQDLMRRYGMIPLAGGQTFQLKIKTAVASGPARRFLVGDPSIQYIDTLAGRTLTRMIAAEQAARPGEVIVSAEVYSALAEILLIKEYRQDSAGQRFGIVEKLTSLPAAVGEIFLKKPLSKTDLRPWLLLPVYTRILTGQNNNLTEIKSAATVFLHFDGLNYDDDPDAGKKLDQFIRWVQNILDRFEGYLLQVVIGDKGSYLYASFGAPVAHGDDPLRAVLAAIKLRQPPKLLNYIKHIKIGISYGKVRTGAYGSEFRKTYGVIGDAVNTACRLMETAGSGQILVSDEILVRVEGRVRWQAFGPVALRGKSKPIQVGEIVGQNLKGKAKPIHPGSVSGRKNEFSLADKLLKQAKNKHGQVLHIEGLSGIGKSHLIEIIRYQADAIYGFQSVKAECLNSTRFAPYAPWHFLLRSLLNLDFIDSPKSTAAQGQLKTLDQMVRQMNPGRLLTLPLLAKMLGLPADLNPTTAAFSADQRQESLHTLIIDLLSNKSLDKPLLLIIEDAQWLDEGSAALVEDLAKMIFHRPIMVVISQRPIRDHHIIFERLPEFPHYQKIILTELKTKHIQSIVEKKVGAPLSSTAVDFVVSRAQGNPYTAGELGTILLERGLLEPADNESWQLSEQSRAIQAGFPVSNLAIVANGLDRLSENEKETVQAAAAIGRLFEFDLLQIIHPHLPEIPGLMNLITRLQEKGLLELERLDPTLIFSFSQRSVQEAAYQMIPADQRLHLHRTIARWYEAQERTDLTNSRAAHHWLLAQDEKRALPSLARAARQAAELNANQDALRCYDQCLELLPADNTTWRVDLLLERQAIFGSLGDIERRRADLDSLKLVVGGRSADLQKNALLLAESDTYFSLGQHEESLKFAREAFEVFETNHIVLGQITALTKLGVIQLQLGRVDEAISSMSAALTRAEFHEHRPEMAWILRQLGIVAEMGQKYAMAEIYLVHALELEQALYNKIGEDATISRLAGVYFQIGDLARCQKMAAASLSINRELGLLKGEASALINLGSVLQALGELKEAVKLFTEANELAKQIHDPVRQSMASYNLSLALLDLQQYEQALLVAEGAGLIDRAYGDNIAHSYSLYAQGLALIELKQYDTAIEILSQAIRLRRKMGMKEKLIDCQAARAVAFLSNGDRDEGFSQICQIIEWLELHGESGIENPARVYAAIVTVLLVTDYNDAAQQWLRRGQAYIQKRARSISEPEARDSFLFRAPGNRDLLDLDLDGYSQNQSAD